MTRTRALQTIGAPRGTHGAPSLAVLVLVASAAWGLPASAPAQTLRPADALLAGSAPDRLAAARALCELGDWPSLRPALVDPAEAVRRLAVACWRPELGDAALVAGLWADPSPSVRTALAGQLAASSDPAAQAALRRLVQDTDVQVRRLAVERVALADGPTALEILRPALTDASLDVAATAAARLDGLGLGETLSADDRAPYEAALALHRLDAEAPEVAAATTALHERISALTERLARAGPTEEACADGARDALAHTTERIDALTREPHAPKDPDRYEVLLGLDDDVGLASQGYYTCLNATPLAFDDGPGDDFFAGSGLLLLGEIDSAWEANFGLLRSDLDGPVEGGDLWVQTRLGVDVFFPEPGYGDAAQSTVPTLELSGRLDRHQLFRHEPLSSWGGGLFARGGLPFSCSGYRPCRLRSQVLGRRSPGLDTDFPERLVAGQVEGRGDVALEVPAGPALTTLTLDTGRLRYEDDALEAAGLDTLGARLEIDSTFQLRLEARRNLYATTGPTEGTPLAPDLDRDATLLGGQLGVRFGDPDPGEGLQLYVLGGMLFPLVDDLDSLDPQVTFTALLIAQDGSVYDDLSRLRLGGERYARSSPRDFALETVSASYLHYTYQGLDLPDSGIRFDARLGHQLTQFAGPLTAEASELDVNVIEGHLGVRVLAAEWIGFEVADTIRAIRFRDRDFEATNRFLIAMFVPFGDNAMGREEAWPW